jgi:hypothetical protein
MGLHQPSSHPPLKPLGQGLQHRCPVCEQPIGQDIVRRIEARQREQYEAVLRRARAEAAAAVEQQVAAARSEAAREAAVTLGARLVEFQAKLAQEQQVRRAAEEQMAVLKAEQQAVIEARVAEFSDGLERLKADLKREKESAVLAEKAKVLKLQTELQDMQRKLEGKSAHELGEGSEVDLYQELRAAFEFDRIQRVAKGVNGADVIQEVVHNGKVCGKIIFDAKNRDAWQNAFASKLKADKLAQGADHAILSSNKFPRDKSQIHCQDGVIVANPMRVLAIVEILRDQLVRMHELRVSNEQRGSKTVELYAFITSEQFKQLVEHVEAQAGKMLDLDAKEQEAHRRVWDQRNKLIRAVQKAKSDLSFEVDRIIGTAGNGPDGEAA